MKKTKLRVEWLVLETLCRSYPEAPGAEGEIRERLSDESFSWGRLLEFAIQHKLQALVADHFLHREHTLPVPRRIAMHLRDILALNRYRNAILATEAARLTGAMQRVGIRVAVRKGLALDLLYSSRGVRVFHDIDILARHEDSARAAELLRNLGYQSGEMNQGSFVPHDRKTVITYRLNPDHLPRLVYFTDDPIVTFVELDIAFSLSWTRSDYNVSTEAVLSGVHSVDIPGGPAGLPALEPRDLFADTVLHLFREAYIEGHRASPRTITLRAFLDIMLLCRSASAEQRVESLRSHLTDLGIERAAGWVLAHVDRVFSTAFLTEFGLAHLVTPEFLGRYRAAGGEIREWNGDMRYRLHTMR